MGLQTIFWSWSASSGVHFDLQRSLWFILYGFWIFFPKSTAIFWKSIIIRAMAEFLWTFGSVEESGKTCSRINWARMGLREGAWFWAERETLLKIETFISDINTRKLVAKNPLFLPQEWAEEIRRITKILKCWKDFKCAKIYQFWSFGPVKNPTLKREGT